MSKDKSVSLKCMIININKSYMRGQKKRENFSTPVRWEVRDSQAGTLLLGVSRWCGRCCVALRELLKLHIGCFWFMAPFVSIVSLWVRHLCCSCLWLAAVPCACVLAGSVCWISKKATTLVSAEVTC